MLNAIFCSANPLLPAAYNAPTRLPALVPTTISGTIPCDSSALITPIWAKPRAAPPPSASAILMWRGALGGRLWVAAGGTETCAVGMLVLHPLKNNATDATRIGNNRNGDM